MDSIIKAVTQEAIIQDYVQELMAYQDVVDQQRRTIMALEACVEFLTQENRELRQQQAEAVA